MYAKGSRYYEDEPVYRSSMEDIDLDFVAEYCKKSDTKNPPRNISAKTTISLSIITAGRK